MIIRLSFVPEVTVAFVTPLSRAIIESITAMTTPMPRMDMAVEMRRAFRLPTVYENGIRRSDVIAQKTRKRKPSANNTRMMRPTIMSASYTTRRSPSTTLMRVAFLAGRPPATNPTAAAMKRQVPATVG